MWDFNLGIGGPISEGSRVVLRNLRDEGSERTVPGMFANANAGDPTKWTYVADRAVRRCSRRRIASWRSG